MTGPLTLAVTGVTGFVGSHLVDLGLAGGHRIRALTRRPQPARDGVAWVEGALDTPGALASLAEGADAFVHVAGATGAPDRAAFAAVNVEGTRAALAAAAGAGVPRFVHVSSLAAREPDLSDYGWSKARSEALVAAAPPFPRGWTIVRPPGVFGPRDGEFRSLFRLLARGWAVLPAPPAGGRTSVIAVGDLARLLLVLAAGDALPGATVEPDDGVPGGWDVRDFMRAVGQAVGRRALPLPLPRALLMATAAVTGRLPGPLAKLTPDRARYLAHADWTAHAPPPPELWHAREDTRAALADTAAWYRANGLL